MVEIFQNCLCSPIHQRIKTLNPYRIYKFNLDRFVDSLISSCYVHLRKSDKDLFLPALDIAQVRPRQVLYIDNTQMLVRIAGELGIRTILHTDYNSTCSELAKFGLENDEKNKLKKVLRGRNSFLDVSQK